MGVDSKRYRPRSDGASDVNSIIGPAGARFFAWCATIALGRFVTDPVIPAGCLLQTVESIAHFDGVPALRRRRTSPGPMPIDFRNARAKCAGAE